MAADAIADIAHRLVARQVATAWLLLCVRVIPAAVREIDGVAVATPDHHLAAAWAPCESGRSRWPEAVIIGSPTSQRALALLVEHLPADATLHLGTLDDCDAVLAAEVLLASDRNLEPYQRAAIEAFAAAERERTRRIIRERYTDRDERFERFRATLAGGGPPDD